jgi:hypothetical protein
MQLPVRQKNRRAVLSITSTKGGSTAQVTTPDAQPAGENATRYATVENPEETRDDPSKPAAQHMTALGRAEQERPRSARF